MVRGNAWTVSDRILGGNPLVGVTPEHRWVTAALPSPWFPSESFPRTLIQETNSGGDALDCAAGDGRSTT